MVSYRLAVVACAFATLVSSIAVAQDANDAAARRAFRLGQAHYENGEFGEAAEQFEEAYRLSGRARLLYNAYLAYRDMQDLPNSARTLRRFLDETADLPASERDQLTARLGAIERAMERQTAPPPDESTTTGETGMGEQEPVETTATSTTTSTTSTGEDTTATTTTTTAGSTSTSTTGGTTDDGGGFNPSPVGFIVAGVGAALGIGAIITGVMSSSELSTLEGRCPDDMCPDEPELRSAQSNGSTLALVTDVLWVTGVVAIAAGVTLIFVLQDGGDESASAGMACTHEGCFGTVQGRF